MKITKGFKAGIIQSGITFSPRLGSIALAVSLAISGFNISQVQAQTFTVLNNNNGGLDSLRRAVLDANTLAGDDTIVFDPSLAHSTILITSEIVIDSASDSLTIIGPIEGKANSIVIDAGGTSRIFNVAPSTGSLTIENITLTNGYSTSNLNSSSSGENGAGIQTDNTDLIINNSVLTGNNALISSSGGAIHNRSANTTLYKTIISGNTSARFGGGIDTSSDLTLTESVLIGNSSASNGAGIHASSSSLLTINQSTISNNTSTAGGFGVGIFARFPDVILNQSTISENKCLDPNFSCDSGINIIFGDLTLNQSTIINNSSNLGTGGISLFVPNSLSTPNVITLNNSIVTGNTGLDDNFSYTLSDPNTSPIPILNVIHSMFGDDPTEVTGDTTGAYFYNNPGLGPLQSNGGPTPTHRPNANSYVLGAGSNALVTKNHDQRGNGFQRIQNTIVDMGAVERQTIINGGNNEVVTRGDMARALLEKIAATPPLFATGLEYHDVQAMDSDANWIAHFKAEGYTEACDTDKFCSDSIVTREEIAKIFLKVLEGSSYQAPTAQGTVFIDVIAPNSFNIDWINEI